MHRIDYEATAAQKAEFLRDGVLIMRGLVPEEWTMRLARIARQQIRDKDPKVGVSVYMSALPEFREFLFSSGLARTVARIADTRSLRLLADELFIKPPVDPDDDNTVDWHNDLPFTPIGEAGPFGGIISTWIALEPVTANMGPLQLMRGSHKWGYLAPFIPDSAPSQLREQVASLGLPNCPNFTEIADRFPGALNGFVSAEMAAGDCVLFTGLTAHGSPPNRGTRPRLGYSIRWLDEHAIYAPTAATMQPPQEIAAQKASGLQPGRPIDRYFELAWSDDPLAFAAAAHAEQRHKAELSFHNLGRNA